MAPLELSDEQRSELASISRSRSLPNGLVERAKIVLACVEGTPNCAVAARMGVSNATVGKWRARYRTYGLEDLHDELRSGRPRTYDDERVAELINAALHTKPPASTQWSVRSMAHTGVSKSTVQRWFAVRRATAPAAVLQVVQRPVLHREGTRHRGTGHVVTGSGTQPLHGSRSPSPSRSPFLSFLRHIDANVPAHLDVHLIVDNYATHKHAAVKTWLAKRPRYQVHYTPTYATWISQVERWFGIITQQAIRRGSFNSMIYRRQMHCRNVARQVPGADRDLAVQLTA